METSKTKSVEFCPAEMMAALTRCVKELKAWMKDHGEDIASLNAIAQAKQALAPAKQDAKEKTVPVELSERELIDLIGAVQGEMDETLNKEWEAELTAIETKLFAAKEKLSSS